MSQSTTKWIANNAITNAKLAQLPANTIKGNNTGSPANAADLTVSQVQTLLSIPTSSSPLSANAGGTGQTSLTLNNVILGNGTSAVQFVAPGTSGNVLTSNGTTWQSVAPAAGGTVTSVALSDASTTPIYGITGSPVTTSGTLTLTLSTQSANTIFAGPTTGSAAQPTFRSLVSADIPNNAANTTGTASNITATSNSTLTTLSALTLPASQLSGTLQAAQFPALTGDVTTSAGSLATTLATVNSNVGTFASVTVNGKGLVTAAAALLGDLTTSGSTATLATVNSNVGTFASVTVNGKGLATAAANLSGDLTTSGSTATLATVNSNVGSFTNANITVNAKGLITAASNGTAGSSSYNIVVKNNTPYTASAGDFVLASGGIFTITLPTASGISGQQIIVKKTDSALGDIITISTTSSQTIDANGTSRTLNTLNEQFIFVSDGSNWTTIDHTYDTAWTNSGPLTITGSTTNPTKGGITSDTFYWRRVGAAIEFMYVYSANATGATAGSGDYLLTLPTGLTINSSSPSITFDSAVHGASTPALGTRLGYGSMNNVSNTGTPATVYASDSTHLKVTSTAAQTPWGSGSFNLNASGGLFISLNGTLPMSGWST